MRGLRNFGYWINDPWNGKTKKIGIIIAFVLCGFVTGALLFYGLKAGLYVLAIIAVVYCAIDCLLFELLGSIVFVFLMTHVGADAGALLGIWFDPSKIDQFMNLIIGMGFIKAIMVVFFILSSVSILTQSVNLFRSNTNVNISHSSEEQK